MFDWIWPAGSGEEDFFLKISVFLHFRYYLPLENGYPLRLNNIKSPTSKDDLCQVWLEEEDFLITPPHFFHFCDYLLFDEDLALYLNKCESSLPNDNLY
jgi:hypothetical protein